MVVSGWMEIALDERMSREEVLCLFGRFKPLHLRLPTSRRSMRILGAIVEAAALPVPDCRKQVGAVLHRSFSAYLSVTITRSTCCKPVRSRVRKRFAGLAPRRA